MTGQRQKFPVILRLPSVKASTVPCLDFWQSEEIVGNSGYLKRLNTMEGC